MIDVKYDIECRDCVDRSFKCNGRRGDYDRS